MRKMFYNIIYLQMIKEGLFIVAWPYLFQLTKKKLNELNLKNFSYLWFAVIICDNII